MAVTQPLCASVEADAGCLIQSTYNVITLQKQEKKNTLAPI